MGAIPFDKFEEKPIQKGKHWRNNFDSNYLRVYWLEGKPRIVTITAVAKLKSSNRTESKEQLLITLAEAPKKWAANVTNCSMIESLTGKTDPTEWIGTRIELYQTKTRDPKGQIVDCIRVREELPAAGAKTEQPKYRQEVNEYVSLLKAAESPADLGAIEDKLAEDNELTPEETQLITKWLRATEAKLAKQAAEKGAQ
jgi:hypothetical protein